MTFKEMPYKRYTIEEGREAYENAVKLLQSAKCADCVMKAKKILDDASIEYDTAWSLADNRFNLNMKDEFYSAEADYYNSVSPLFRELFVSFGNMLLDSPFRKELEEKINPRYFKKLEIAKKSFSPEVIEDLQKENALVTEYAKLMSGMTFDWDGKKLPLSAVRGYLEHSDRNVRRKCAYAIGEGLRSYAEQLDGIYDRLVKIRTEIARKMGYENYIELGYNRMRRLDYNAEMVAAFRENVKEYLVPVVEKLKNDLAKGLGIKRITFYDNDTYTPGPAPEPILDKEGIFKAATEMYDDMHPEIGKFMREMIEAEAFDVDAREGKWGGGYCSSIPKYKQPFILANFNGTSGDIDVITHEFGHALASHYVYYGGDMDLGSSSGMETAECHSMSMEFLSWKYIDKFFGPLTKEYKKKHLLSALSFIPYGVIVDEFQHEIYAHPEYTPEERKSVYRALEEKYRPYLDYADIPYIGEGTRWQYQMHIYESPFYYIDYCLAQTVALWFLIKSEKDYQKALEDYLAFVKTGGQKSFPDLIKSAGIPSPFEADSLKTLSEKVLELKQKLD